MANKLYCFLAACCLLTHLVLQNAQAADKEKTYLEKFQESYEKKDYSASLGFIQKHLLDNPNDPLGHYFKGLVYYAEGNNEESIKCFEYSIKLGPDQAKAWTGLGKGLYNIQDYRKSLEAMQMASKKSPKDPENYLYLGKALYYQKAYSVAVRCFDKTIELDPKNKEAKTLRGSCFDKLAFQKLVLLKSTALVEMTKLIKGSNGVPPKNQDSNKNTSEEK